jgi:hypothetical protein
VSNRCPDCNKFVSLELQEPELNLNVEGDSITGQVRLVLTCADCGGEAKEANLDIDLSLDHDCDRKEDDFELVDETAEPTERYQDKDQRGKSIKNPRYRRHYYGAEITVTVRCNHCDKEFEVTETVEEQASGFEELW